MKLNFYIAAALDDASAAEQLADALVAQGHAITFAWWRAPSLRDVDPTGLWREFRERANTEVTAVRRADLVIAILPGGVGTHVEIGVALGAGKPVILLDAPDLIGRPTDGGRAYPCAFHFADGVTRCRIIGQGDVVVWARACLNVLPLEDEVWQHHARGTKYVIKEISRIQAHHAGAIADDAVMVTYESHDLARTRWTRALGEFTARFTRIVR